MAIKAAFGSDMQSTHDNSSLALKSYVEALRKETGKLLHPYPN
mgnify:CR=1 FL=1